MVISSSAVYSGLLRAPTEEAECDPVTEYGAQKAALEIAALAEVNTGVARITKVLHGGETRWCDWARKIRQGDEVEAFTNVRFAPLRLSRVVDSILILLQSPLTGIVHVSPPDDLTYAAAVRIIADEMGLPIKLREIVADPDAGRGIFPDRFACLASSRSLTYLAPESSQDAVRRSSQEYSATPTVEG